MPPRRHTFKRSRSHGPPPSKYNLPVEGSRYSAPTTASNTQLVPYSPWKVILYRRPAGQVVLYNQDSSDVEVRHVVPETLTSAYLQPPASKDMSIAHRKQNDSLGVQPYTRYICPTCLQSLPAHTTRAWETRLDTGADSHSSAGVISDRDYFNMLARSLRLQQTPLALSDGSSISHNEEYRHLVQGKSNIASMPVVPVLETGASMPAEIPETGGVAESSFNQGYYERFFAEQRKLGKGLRGSVFSCQHILDGVYLGHYAVKKVAVGNNHQWLKRMLREVKLLESLRHPNVVEYKHSWLEMHQMTAFGPKVPCLFILMEYANGGNLQEYMEPKSAEPGGSDSEVSLKQKILKMRRSKGHNAQVSNKATAGKRILSIEQIWSFFSDICNGLAHLHQLQIIHRDLKHMNLLLHWKDSENKDANGEMPRLMLTDFGECEVLSHIEKRDRTGATGTMEFMAPELLEVDDAGRYLDSYSTKSDMWSLGMVLYYLCYSQLPFQNIDDVDILRKDVLKLRYADFAKASRSQGAEEVPPELRYIMKMLLKHNESERPDIGEVIHFVAEQRDLWRSRNCDESRFEINDLDVSNVTTPKIESPIPKRQEGQHNLSKMQLTSDLSRFSPSINEKSLESMNSLPPLALVPANYGAASSTNTHYNGLSLAGFRRHSTGQDPFDYSGASSPLTEDSSDDSSSRFASPVLPEERHDSLIEESSTSKAHNRDSSRSSSTTTSSHVAITKRQLANYANSEEHPAKRQRHSADLHIQPAFYLKTAILLAKVHWLHQLDMANEKRPLHMAYLAGITLIMSAVDIQQQSLRMSLILLLANMGLAYTWLYLFG
ncbi:putative serine/threonine-protein kinase iks1 [Coemansia sp. RSA 1085]|nr:putative serine/threonine-protein kinase iks1 [Coemansia sp. RSA 1085]